jgi:hypothetical protein
MGLLALEAGVAWVIHMGVVASCMEVLVVVPSLMEVFVVVHPQTWWPSSLM